MAKNKCKKEKKHLEIIKNNVLLQRFRKGVSS
jgi:hypothetical protein